MSRCIGRSIAVCVRPAIALLFEVMRADLSPITKIVAKFARPRSS
jgi:hypothetical protein